MVNSLDESIMENVCRKSVEYVNLLKRDNEAFFEFLDKNKNFSNDYECLVELCRYNPEFTRSEYFRDRKRKIIENYTLNIKSGEIIQNADNLTVVGSPYAMLLYGISGNELSVDFDDTLLNEQGTIQCYTNRFSDGEYLAFFRSPFNSKNNLLYLHNHYDDRFDKYFKFSENIIAINMIGTDAQDRANGMDMDSDFGLTTNQPDIVEHARRSYLNYPTIVNNIPKEKNTYMSNAELKIPTASYQHACKKLLNSDISTSAELRFFLDKVFMPYLVMDNNKSEGKFTAYYESTLDVSNKQGPLYKYPIYSRPRDLIEVNINEFDKT